MPNNRKRQTPKQRRRQWHKQLHTAIDLARARRKSEPGLLAGQPEDGEKDRQPDA